MSASAPQPRTGSVRPLRGIPRSRAFWELKAEQMMNRIFDPEEPIDLAVEPAHAEPPRPEVPAGPVAPASATSARTAASSLTAEPRSAAGTAETPRSRPLSRPFSRRGAVRPATAAAPAAGPRSARPDERLVLVGALCGVCVISVAGSLAYFGFWNRLQQNLAQERNLLLVERLRSLGPATATPVSGPEPQAPALPAPAGSQAAASGDEGLPPPPPVEPWMEQLASLPQATPPAANSSRLLTVPVSPRLSAATRPAAPDPPPAPLPHLVGVVAGAGRASSAIFLVGGSSMSVSSGEQIGSSGWRLRSAEGETALIERGGELRQVSIASGNGF